MKIIRYALLIGFGLFIGTTMPTVCNCMQTQTGAQPSFEEEMAALEASGYTETLVATTQAQDLEHMERLLRDGKNANECINGIRPLWWAIFNRDNKAIILLRTFGADPELICNATTAQTAAQFAKNLLRDAFVMRPHLIPTYKQVLLTLTQPLTN